MNALKKLNMVGIMKRYAIRSLAKRIHMVLLIALVFFASACRNRAVGGLPHELSDKLQELAQLSISSNNRSYIVVDDHTMRLEQNIHDIIQANREQIFEHYMKVLQDEKINHELASRLEGQYPILNIKIKLIHTVHGPIGSSELLWMQPCDQIKFIAPGIGQDKIQLLKGLPTSTSLLSLSDDKCDIAIDYRDYAFVVNFIREDFKWTPVEGNFFSFSEFQKGHPQKDFETVTLSLEL